MACALGGCGADDGSALDPDASVDDAAPDAPDDAPASPDALPPSCAPSFHPAMVCAPCDASAGPCTPICQPACVPDDEFCPFACPAGMTCEVVGEGGGDPASPVPWRHAGCVPTGSTLCTATTCGAGQHCAPLCLPCTTPGCTWIECTASCEPDPSCAFTACGPGRCFDDCAPDRFDDDVCIGDHLGFDECDLTLCWPGTACSAACATDAATCASTCANTCTAAADDACRGPIACADPPPSCPADTVPGIANGCWGGYCIPIDQCQHPCAVLTTEVACRADAQCEPRFRNVCEVTPGGLVCHLEFERCGQVPIVVPPMEGP